MAQRFENIISTQSVGSGDIDKLVNSFNLLSKSIDDVNKKSEQIKPPKWESFAASAKQFIQDPLNAAGEAAEKFLLKLGPVGAAVSVAAVGLGVLAKVGFDAERSLGQLGDRIGDISVRTGLTVKEVQEFSLAMKMAGGDISGVEGMMRKLSQGLADGSEEGKKSAEGMRELGIATRGFNGGALPMSQIIVQLSDKLAGMTDTAQRNAVAVKIMGRSALEALPDLLELSANLKSAGTSAKLFATEEDLRTYDAYLKQVSKLDAEWEALKRHMKEPLVGVVSVAISVGGKAVNAAEWLSGLLGAAQPASVPNNGGIDATDPRWQLIGSHIRAGAVEDAASIAAGSATVAGDRKRYGLTVEGSQYDAEKAKQNAVKLRDEYFALEGQGSRSAVDKKRQEWQEAEASAARLTERVKILAKEESERIAVLEKIRDLIREGESAYVIGSGAGSKIVTGSELNSTNARPRRIPSLYGTREYNPNLALLQSQFNPSPDLTPGLQVQRGDLVFVSPSSERANPAAAGLLAAQGQGALEYAKQQQQGRLSDISGTSEYLTRLAELRGQPGQEKSTALEVAKIRDAALQQELLVTGDIVRFRESSLQNEIDLRLKLAEISKQEVESFKNLAVGFADAGRSGGGAGLSRFVLGQVGGLENKVIGNAAGLIYPTISKGLDLLHSGSSNSTIGKLLAGTPFGPDQSKTAIDVNTLVTRANTDATQMLTNALASLRGSAVSPAGGGGSAGGLGAIGGALFSSATPTDAEIAAAGITPDAMAALNDVGTSGPDATGGFSTSAASTVATKNSLTVAKGIGIGAAAAAAGFGAYSGFKAGGAQGVASGLGSLAGGAAAIMSLAGVTGPAAPIVAGVGLALGVFASLLGDPKANRSAEIQRHLKYNQFLAPEALNVSSTTGGSYADFDRFGGVRSSDLSSFPNVQQGYFDYRHNTTVPGRTLSNFGSQIIVQVQTMDAKSFTDNHQNIGDAVVLAIHNHTGLQEAVRNL